MAPHWRTYAFAALAIVLVIAGLIRAEVLMDSLSAGVVAAYDEREKAVVQIMLDQSKAYTGWSVALMGAVALFIKGVIEKPGSLNRPDLFLLALVLAAAFVSVFFAQLAAERIYRVLAVEQAPQTDDGVRLFLRIQYLSGLSALAIFAFFLFRASWSKLDAAPVDQST